MKRTFSTELLRRLFRDDDFPDYPDDSGVLLWEHTGAIVETKDSADSHGTAVQVIFEHENAFWRVCIGYHHEDWSSTNDLVQERELDAERVYPHVITKVEYKTEPPSGPEAELQTAV